MPTWQRCSVIRSFQAIAVVIVGTSSFNVGSFAAEATYPAAVSALNGKFEIAGGVTDYNFSPPDDVFQGAASLSLPIGDSIGFQGDIAAKELNGKAALGGGLHLFTRNPESYLLGITGGYAASKGASTAWAGGEAELYLENVSLEIAAGYLHVDPKSKASKGRFFVVGDAAFYPAENLRLSLGASSVAGFESANSRIEYLFETTPISISLTGQFGEDKYKSASVGLSFYFGGDESTKTLKTRHREDDPRNRVVDVLNSGAAVFGKREANATIDPEAACNAIPDHAWVDGECRDYSRVR